MLWVAVLLAVGCVSGATTTPKFKWWQTKDDVIVTIEVECATDRHVALTDDEFKWKCNAADGTSYALEFLLRDDINSSLSSCEPKRGAEECTLRKSVPHTFDRLPDDPKPFKKFLKTEWRSGRESDEDGDEENDFYDGTKVEVVRTEKKLQKALNKNELVMMDVSYPWCTRCTHTQEKFAGAAREMKKKAKFIYVDAREVRSIRKMVNVACDHDCVFWAHRKGEKLRKVAYKPEVEDQVALFQKYTSPLLLKLATKDDVQKARKQHKSLLFGRFATPDDIHVAAFQEAAEELRETVPCAVAYGAVEGHKDLEGGQPKITLFKPTDEQKVTYTIDPNLDGPLDAADLTRWTGVQNRKLIETYTYEIRKPIDEMKLAPALVFVDDKDKEATAAVMKVVRQVAPAFRGKLQFVQVGKSDNSYMMEDYGLNKDGEGAAFGIGASFDYDAKKYGHEGDMTAESMTEFANNYLDGKLKPSYKSEPVPEEGTAGEVTGSVKIVGKTLSSFIKAEKDVVVVLYKSWMDGWEEKKKAIEQVIEVTSGVEKLTVGVMDTDKNQWDPEGMPEIDKYHSDVVVLMLGADQKITKMKGKKVTRATVLKFIKGNSGAVEDAWESVMEKVEAILKAEKEEERLKQEKIKAEEERVAKIPKIDLTGDEGVFKQILEEGEGPVVNKGAKVKAEYTGTLLDGTQFDSSRGRAPFEFTLDSGGVIKCWDKAFATMKKGEKALITCRADYAYGSGGSGKIPADATIKFDVELLSFEGGEPVEEAADAAAAPAEGAATPPEEKPDEL